MIAKMIHYSFMLYHRDIDNFMQKLQELGVVDITKKKREQSQEDIALLATVNQYQQMVREMKRINQDDSAQIITNPEQLASEWTSLNLEIDQYKQTISQISKEIELTKVWGDFPEDLLQRYSNLGLSLRFFECSSKKYNPVWENQYPISVIDNNGSYVRFVLIDDHSIEVDLPIATELKAPSVSSVKLIEDLNKNKLELEKIEDRLVELAGANKILSHEINNLLTQYDFSEVKNSADVQVENTLLLLEGYVPEENNETLKAFLDNESVVYFAREAKVNEPAPILFKNGKFAKPFEIISKLYSTPTYGELDLTPLFAPFFMLFFGFCLGDGGYGLILLIAATIGKRKMPKMKDAMTLVQLLGLSTIIFSLFTASAFGISLGETDLLAKWKDKFLTFDGMFSLSLIFGGIQIFYGMCVKAVNKFLRFGWKYAISTIGWILLLGSCVGFYLLGNPNSSVFAMGGIIHIVLLVIACIAIFFFNSPDSNPLVNIGFGLWDSYNMATGLLGDMLSYIRLFALNLSGGILGGVFNSLAIGLSPDIPVVGFIVTFLILIFGHSINLFMNALGSFVHPIRLTFVEFYKNAGYDGAGRVYNPFKIRN